MTEKEITLIKLAQKGDSAAFGDLVAKYDGKVMNLAMSLLGSAEDAQDVYQEIFTKVYRSLKKYRFQSEFFTWLYRITVNTCMTFRKGRGRQKERFPVSLEENPAITSTLSDADAREGEDSLLQDELSHLLQDAVNELPPKQRTVVVLRHYHHHKIREIAQIMSLNEGTVKGYLFRAVRTMKEKLEPYMQGEL